jgi:hypothetical protein
LTTTFQGKLPLILFWMLSSKLRLVVFLRVYEADGRSVQSLGSV